MDCRDHILAWHLYPSGGNGLDGRLAIDEIGALLGAVRLAWVLSVRGKGVSDPMPPPWVREQRALRDYFSQLGPYRDLNPSDEETDEEAAERLCDLPLDHSALVRDFLLAVLPECGWEGLAIEEPSEADEDTGIECLGSISWWSADPKGVTEKLRTKLLNMLTKAEPMAGGA
jgi:hypothetical protein